MSDRVQEKRSWIDKIIRFCLENKLVVGLATLFIIGWGLYVAPFDWTFAGFSRNPVPVDAIPDIGENQQIVFTDWPGRSPQDVEYQVTYPLTVSLLGLPEVKTIRSISMFGFSSIFIIFKEKADFYWCRSRVNERMNVALQYLPPGVVPRLGPEATPVGQIFWYTLEGKGFDLQELRSIQDWNVRYGIQSAEGVTEVASIGGFVKEYQVDVDPDAMRAFGVSLYEVFDAVRRSNIDVGARTIEVNRVEYVIRGLGFIKSPTDVENTVIKAREGVPVYIKNVAKVSLGPALRRGALDKEGAEAVGGVVVVRHGANPLEVIKNVKKKIEEISPGLPKKMLPDGTVSEVKIVPFYDRTKLIFETLGTLEEAITEEVIVTIIVVIMMVMHLRSSLVISMVLPLAVLMAFIGMKLVGVDANIVSLSGIAIAIGTVVDMGIIMCENILKHMKEAKSEDKPLEIVYRAASEVGSAVVTAIATTVVSFLPVFAMTGAEGKLFRPLAYTKTFALMGSVIVAVTLVPSFAQILFFAGWGRPKRAARAIWGAFIVLVGVVAGLIFSWWVALVIILFGTHRLLQRWIPERFSKFIPWAGNIVVLALVLLVLTRKWLPLGPEHGTFRNFILVAGVIEGMMLLYQLFQLFYAPLLTFFLRHKLLFLSIPTALVVFALVIWLGFAPVFGQVPKVFEKVGIKEETIRSTTFWVNATHEFPGLGKEFMPPLEEGSFLFMPSTMPHASIGEVLDIIQKQDIAISAIPEVESVVGKIGRAESPLDPAPISMIETVITYKDEYRLDPLTGKRYIDPVTKKPVRQWRPSIKSPDDIWEEIKRAGEIPGSTSAPRLQPIAARLVMLQSGMRAPMGVKVYGKDLEEIQNVGFAIEKFLKEVPSVVSEAVVADRIVGVPYLEIAIDREAVARYGVNIRDVQDVIETAIGGEPITTTVEGRERYPVRVRYLRELRDSIEELGRILVPAMMSERTQIPITQVAEIRYIRGPQMIRSEDTRLVSYVLFDKKPGYAEVDVVEEAKRYLNSKVASGELVLPSGTSYIFAGSYQQQVSAQKTFMVVIPVALFLIFLILYFQFHSVSTTILVFSGIAVAGSGGFLMIWLFSQDWFLNFAVFGVNLREIFQVHKINLSVAIWVGFLALFGIATDDGVVIATYLDQSFARTTIRSIEDIRQATLAGGKRRIRPCLMTTATTVLALLPVLTSSGRGADVMMPMAIPSFGGMTIELLTLFVVPVCYCLVKEIRFRFAPKEPPSGTP